MIVTVFPVQLAFIHRKFRLVKFTVYFITLSTQYIYDGREQGPEHTLFQVAYCWFLQLTNIYLEKQRYKPERYNTYD